jgi:hypothetical protein
VSRKDDKYLAQLKGRNRKASRKERSAILNDTVKTTRWLSQNLAHGESGFEPLQTRGNWQEQTGMVAGLTPALSARPQGREGAHRNLTVGRARATRHVGPWLCRLWRTSGNSRAAYVASDCTPSCPCGSRP